MEKEAKRSRNIDAISPHQSILKLMAYASYGPNTSLAFAPPADVSGQRYLISDFRCPKSDILVTS